MIVLSILGLVLTGVVIVYSFMHPQWALPLVFLTIVGSVFAAEVLSKNHFGVPVMGQEGASIRQDSITSGPRIMYFGSNGYYGRSHMGGGLMGGK